VKARKQFRQSLKTSVVKSALIHVCVILLFAVSPGFNIAIKDKPVDVVWVELPKGTGDDISLGVGPPGDYGYPAATVEQQQQAPPEPTEPPPMEQEPLEVKPKVAIGPDLSDEGKPGKPEKPKIEKSVVTTTRMTYGKKGAPRRRQVRRMRKTDRTIAGALAAIDKSLSDRSAGTGTGYGGTGTGYRYGTGTRPIRVPPTDPEYIKYQARVRSRIMSNWIVPERFASAGTRANARLIVMINMNGEVISTRWSKPSGNPTFDESAKRAVNKASPFPKPPERLAWETYNEGFLIEFDARVR
jgi:TonB family protein